MVDRKRVMLLIESSRAYGRGCLLGVAAYVRSHGHWSVLHIERGLTEGLPRFLQSWKGDGIIARIENEKIAHAVAELGVPAVDLRGSHRPVGGGMLDTDPRVVTRMAAEHFLDIGFRNFAYIGYPGVDFSERRIAAFRDYLRMRGLEVHVYTSAQHLSSHTDVLAWEARGELEGPAIAAWLQSLPRPLAVFACNDVRGRQIIEACNLSGLAVPEEVAVIGVDDDEVICELCNPPLSSVQPDTMRLGYEGAALLDAMMEGEPAPSETIFIPPKGISRRLSSEAAAIDDREVAAAMQIIRDHACEGLTVQDVVKRLNISRSTLERRFYAAFNRTPAAEIERIRMSRAKLLLMETRYKLSKIAALTGYGTASQFATAFKRNIGATPGEFRKQTQL
ncbi:MAG: XylR family transcriptional regulator [Planctomycetota bacterium]|nr:MAG: XylR family transcriptional regulator [Planctomycetota bacterium]